MFEVLTKPHVGKLKIRSSAVDDPGLRLSLCRILNSVELGSGGLNPAEIMIVKKLEDPLPGTMPVLLKKPKQISVWQQAVQDQLRQQGRNAMRPVKGYIPDNSQTIIFNDAAELVSCLILDLVKGNTGRHWWWKLLLKHVALEGSLSRTVCSVLSYDLYQLPSVLKSLYAWQAADKVLGAIEPEDARILTITLARTLGHTTVAAILEGYAPSTGTGGTDRQANIFNPDSTEMPRIVQPPTRANDVSGITGTEPVFHQNFWRQHLNDVPLAAGMGRERVFLLGLGLLFQRKPWQTLNRDFQQQLYRLWGSSEYCLPQKIADSTPGQEPVDSAERRHGIDASTEMNRAHDVPDYPANIDSRQPNHSVEKVATSVPLDADTTGDGAFVKMAPPSPDTDKRLRQQRLMHESDAQSIRHELHQVNEAPEPVSESSQDKSTGVSDSRDESGTSIQPRSEADSSTGQVGDLIVSGIGGVLYLINLMKKFDLPSCFESDWQLASRVGPWTVLEVLGRTLLEDQSALHEYDPIWAMLAKLDGRQPGEQLAPDYVGCDHFRLPVDWYQSIHPERQTYRWSTDRERLHIWSSSGILLVNLPLNDDLGIEQVELELKPYLLSGQPVLFSRSEHDSSPLVSDGRVNGVSVSAGIQLWLDQIMPAIRYSMTLALDSGSFVETLELPAKIYLSSSHIDLVTSVDNISMPARLSGLDQNPGWLPEMGKVVLFHFE